MANKEQIMVCNECHGGILLKKMKRFLSPARNKGPVELWAWSLLLACTAGCGQSDIKVYRVPKDSSPAELAAADGSSSLPAGHPATSGAPAPFKYTVPTGWEEVAPGEMRSASFRIKGADGKLADVGIFPFGISGSDLNNVNRWRGQVGQSPVTETELAKLAQPVQVGDQNAQLYEQAGKAQGSDEPTRILGVILPHGGMNWFFKMSGSDDLVQQQKTAFIDFLKSIRFPSATAGGELPPDHPPINGTATAAAAPPSDQDESKPKWQVPAGWRETSGQFLVSKFLITGPNDTRASVNVSVTGGGVAANVNRWRGQLGLKPLSQADLDKEMQPLEVSRGKAMVIDMTGTDPATNQKARLVGAMVIQGDQTWYYKLMGNAELVTQQKDSFLKFVKTAIYK